jgi:hypothetical protein
MTDTAPLTEAERGDHVARMWRSTMHGSGALVPTMIPFEPLSEAELAATDHHCNTLRAAGHDTVLWDRASATIRAMKAEMSAQAEAIRMAREALIGINDDYMTSKTHHPGYVLIPTAKFEQLCAALAKIDASGGKVG